MDAPPHGLDLTLRGDLAELERLTAAVGRFREEQSLDDDAESNLNLVLEELFLNSIEHGGCRGLEGAVQISLACDHAGVRVRFSDRGAPFAPAQAPAPDLTAPLEERCAGGLGVHFVRQIMQDFDYAREDGWNRLTMRLKTK